MSHFLGFMHERISYYEILRATSNLSQENMNRERNSQADFQTLKGLGDGNGKNEMHLLCSIVGSLVMKYMPNGNLDKWLHSSSCFLNFEQRLGIMTDVASAVEYLHHGYSSPIVHCDMKPNNVLLDEDMGAHVSDFGIVKLLTEDQLIVQTKNLGTIGYVAPECTVDLPEERLNMKDVAVRLRKIKIESNHAR
ncbi:UNVERIFIED_CONTAM: putative LRR receptor-like serine/threonine-protein kinase [Sesamum latifolium]|uniref:LRR receptor-like serine/threonine-protein kinase n=1 Tax=Sesamum latifolium TaxID=2727402 RepID=A0AAW2WTU2_9LAMI